MSGQDLLTQLEEDLCDDGTSCTSSLATTISISEDLDDLYLGAEANSFGFLNSRKENEAHVPRGFQKFKESKFGNLVVMKELYTSIESNDTNRTYSSITSVVDLLAARESNPGEILANIGFASNTEEDDRKDILSRFKPSPLLNTKDNRLLFPQSSNETFEDLSERKQDCHPNIEDSINKTEEWLSHHHTQQATDDASAANSKTLKTSAISSEHTASLNKRGGLQRIVKPSRRRFSKSSSFELLLPNLKEEESNPEGEDAAQDTNAAAKNALYSTIRESSLEHVGSVTSDPGQDRSRNTDNSTFTHDRTGSNHVTEKSSSNREVVTDDVKNMNMNEASAIRREKLASLFRSNQMESFEMEEISSNAEEANECQQKRRVGVVAMSTDRRFMEFGDERITPSPESEGDENETSSGFDEDDMLATATNQHLVGCRQILPSTVIEKVEMKCWCDDTMQSSSHHTRFVYDITLGDNGDATDHLPSCKTGNFNLNNNVSDVMIPRTPVLAKLRAKSVDDISCRHLTLRCAGSKGSKPSSSCIVTPCSKNGDIKEKETIGKSRRLMSNTRVRRKEFASRSALSGDSMQDFFMTSLVKHNGSYAIRKRRRGSFHYYGNLDDIDDMCVASSSPGSDVTASDVETKLQDDVISVDEQRHHCSDISAAKSSDDVSLPIRCSDLGDRGDTTGLSAKNNESSACKRNQLLRQRTLPAQSSDRCLQFSTSYCGQCYG